MLTWRMLHFSRMAMSSILALPEMISSTQARPRAIDLRSPLADDEAVWAALKRHLATVIAELAVRFWVHSLTIGPNLRTYGYKT